MCAANILKQLFLFDLQDNRVQKAKEGPPGKRDHVVNQHPRGMLSHLRQLAEYHNLANLATLSNSLPWLHWN